MASQFVVDANANSVSGGVPKNTGITLSKGQILTISVPADDTWSAGTGPRTSNANGLGNPLGNDFGFFTYNGFSFLYGSLIGSLDNGKTFFPVGTRLEMTMLSPSSPPPAGVLLLYYWDVNKADNTGSVTATVAVYKGPV